MAGDKADMRALRPLIRRLQALFPGSAFATPEGLLCAGGELSVPLLLAAYGLGIFPWYNEGDPVLWWNPPVRCVMLPGGYHLPRRAARAIRHAGFVLTLDRAFPRVIAACGNLRRDREGTWITPEVERAYNELHEAGFAHSVEAWQQGRLVGGLYGVALGRAFFGESMFHLADEASRACLAGLVDLLRMRGVTLLDCQQETPHVMAQGAVLLPRRVFSRRLQEALAMDRGAGDALTREYVDDPSGAYGALWPFLPWRTRYRREGGTWAGGGMELLDAVPAP